MATKNTVKLLVPLATAGLAAVVTFGSGATWTSKTDPRTVTVTAGKILTTVAPGEVELNLNNLQPGQSVSGTVDITNGVEGETLDGTLDLEVSAPTFEPTFPADAEAYTNFGRFFYLKVEYWDYVNGAWVQLDSNAFGDVPVDPATTTTLQDDYNFDSGATRSYRFTASLSIDAPNAVQGASAATDFTWTATPTLDENGDPTDQTNVTWTDPSTP